MKDRAEDLGKRAQPMQGTTPPSGLGIGPHAFAGNLKMTEVAASKLIHEERIEKRKLGMLQILGPARFLPQQQIQPQPVRLGAAFVSGHARLKVLRYGSLNKKVV